MNQAKLRLRAKDQLALFTDLSTMLKAGIPLLEAIESLEPDAKGNLQKILAELHRSLANGETLSHAMARFPLIFEPVTVNLMRAAESGGTLEETLQDIVATMQKEIAFSSSLKTAMIYPAFVMGIFGAVVVLLLTFVIPRISQVFANLHVNTPLATRVLMKASTFFLAHWVLVLVAVVAVIVLLTIFIKTHLRAMARVMLSLPGFKRLGLNIDLARLTRSLALLLKSGVPLDETLVLAKRSVNQKSMIAIVEQMQRSMSAGKPLATGLRDSGGVVPIMMVRSMETAEGTGTLEQALQSLAEHFDTQVAESLKGVSSLLEPLMIVIVGLLVGGLVITVIAPIYNMISQFKPTGV